MIAGLLLAAGRSRRFGGDKLLAPLAGKPVIRWSADALACGVDALYVVTSIEARAHLAALEGLDVTVVEHPERDLGLASSIAAGIAALGAEVEAVVVALADQPLVDVGVVRALRDRWSSAAPRVLAVAPRYRDGRGHPVLFARAAFASLGTLRGDRGARDLLDAMGTDLLLVDVDAPSPSDVDTPEMLAVAEESIGRRGERQDPVGRRFKNR